MSTSATRMLHGCLLAHPEWFGTIAEVFSVKDFSDAVDQKLWETFAELHEQGKQASPLDALEALESVDTGEAVAQLASLMRLCEFETTASFKRRVDILVKTVVRTKTKRGLQRALKAIDDDAVDIDWPSTIADMGAKLRQLDRRKTHYTPLTFERFLETASTKRRKVVIPTGFAEVDKKIGGFVVGQTTAILARTNAGKSSLLAALARNQLFAHAARHPEREVERARQQGKKLDPYTERLAPSHARHPEVEGVGERPPYMLILSVEDDVDDYLGRFICDLCDIDGKDFMLDPGDAVFGGGHGERLEHIGRATTADGRLTIADYESEDGDDEKTINEIEKTILGWVQLIQSKHDELGEDLPPLLVLLDYFQKIELPDEEGQSTPEVRLLKRASSRLHKLAKKNAFAFVPAVMLLRGHDAIEPDHNDARGGSDVIQDAETALTIWPFGPSERNAFAERAAESVEDGIRPLKPTLDDDSFEAATAEQEFADAIDDNGDFEDMSAGVQLDVLTLRRATRELLITCHKARHAQAGWQVPLEFHRDKKRITDAYDPSKVYRRDPSISSVLKEHRKLQGEKKR